MPEIQCDPLESPFLTSITTKQPIETKTNITCIKDAYWSDGIVGTVNKYVTCVLNPDLLSASWDLPSDLYCEGMTRVETVKTFCSPSPNMIENYSSW